tara:strand:- start:4258 stop:6243 length:1986 start_codon:yes stop_codon:yes gene_type:complete
MEFTNTNIVTLSFIAAAIKLIIAGIIYSKNRKAHVNIIFALIFLSQGIWDLGKGLMWITPTKDIAFLFGKISYVGYILSVFLFAHFCWVYLQRKNFFSRTKLGLTLWYLPCLILIIALFTSNYVIADLLAPGVVTIGYGLELWMYSYGLFYNYFFFVFQILPFLYGFIIFLSKYIKSDDKDLKNRLKYIILGVSFPIIIGIPTGIILPQIGIRLPPHNNLLTLIMSIFIGIGILKYKLLSISSALESPSKSISFSSDIKNSRFNHGSSYLIENPDSKDTAYHFFLYNLYQGNHGFILTSTKPEEVRKKYSLTSTPIAWITDTETDETSFGHHDVEQIYGTIEQFLDENPNSFVMLDCLPTLIKHNNFKKVEYLLKRFNVLIKQHSAILIAPYGDLKLSKKEKIILNTDFTYKTAKGKLASLTGSMIDLYRKTPGKEQFIILGYNTVTKAVLDEFIARKLSCTVVTPKQIPTPYPKYIKFIQKDPLIKVIMQSLKIDSPNVNIIVTYESDAKSILAVNLIRHITQKARVLVEVNREKYIDIARKAGANEVVASSAIGGKLLAMSLSHPTVVEWFMDSLTPKNQNLEVQELAIAPRSPLIGKSILQADKIFHDSMNILSVSRQGKSHLTHTDDYKIQAGDTIIVIVHKERLNKDKKLMKFFKV